MQKLFLSGLIGLIVQILFICTSYGQVNPNDTTILLDIIRHTSTQYPIIYVDTVPYNSYVQENVQAIFQKGKITERTSGESITLTKKESAYILSQLGQTSIWPKNSFLDSKPIAADSLTSFLDKIYKQQRHAYDKAVLNNDIASLNSENYPRPYVFEFIKPIYIRNNTVCLISYYAMCGRECGYAETSFYKKDKKGWAKWITVTIGDF